MIKRFLEWLGLKKRLHNTNHQPPLVSEREIWWASVGENIGSEINGKSELFSRPVIIFKKLAHGFYFVIPTTTQTKAGSWFVPIRQHGKNMVACLHQSRAIDYRRLSTKLGELDDEDAEKVRLGFEKLYINPSPFMHYFYIIQSIKKINEIYSGSTNNLEKRFDSHNQGKVASTKRYVPWRLAYYEAYASEEDAREREQKFKRHGKGNNELKKRIARSLKGEG